VDAEAAFVRTVRRGAAARPEAPELLEGRVRRALAADRAAGFPSEGGAVVSLSARRPLGKRSFALAGLAVAAAAALWLGGRDVQPTDAAAVDAARTLEEALNGTVAGLAAGPAGCEQGTASPYRFPAVRSRELELATCVQTDGKDRSVSVLRTGADARTPRALVSVATATAPSGRAPVIGVTEIGEAVVFDVSIGGAKYYLAAPRAFVAAPRGSCAACHGTSREGKADPHTWSRRHP
jgi:hypothetical protein